jgi:hypothetical protein
MTVLELAQARIPELKKKTANEWAGPCPGCGGTDRFMVWTHRNAWHCRRCEKTGDALEFLRAFDGMSCPDAHEALGQSCLNAGCPAREKCRLGERAGDSVVRPKKPATSVSVPQPPPVREFVPGTAQTPRQIWMTQAEALVNKAHAALLACPEQVAYLSGRGLPLEAIEKGRLGWLAENRYPSRESWGLPTELKEDGKKKKMFIPAGILIPFFDAERRPHRIRIRRAEISGNESRYYWLQGSGDDVPVIGGAKRPGVVVVESDLDAFMVRWQCRDLDVSVIPLGTCGAKPKGWAMQALESALAILVAHDFEPRHNEKTGRPENPGGQGARWWLQQFPRAVRWPVPAGKDPGEYYQDHGGNIRAWVLAGLPPIFHVRAEPQAKPKKEKPEPVVPAPAETQPDALSYTLTSSSGRSFCIVETDQDARQVSLQHPGLAIFTSAEIQQIKDAGLSKAEAESLLLVRQEFGYAGPLEIRPLVGDGQHPQTKRDPSRARAARRERSES